MRKIYRSLTALSVKSSLALFKNDTKGAFAIIAALLLLPVIAMTMGGAVDYARYLSEREKIQTALDAAILSSAQHISTQSESETETYIQKIFNLNLRLNQKNIITPPLLHVTVADGLVTAVSKSAVKTSFLRMIGIQDISFPLTASIRYAATKVDVVLALDVSGSMRGNNLSQLQAASLLFLNTLFGSTKNNHPSVQVGIVPFAHYVQLDPQFTKNKSWIDMNALSPIHSENFSTPINRFDLFKEIGIPWKGCIESRPYPYDVHDYDPTSNEMTQEERNANTDRNARFFVPWFEPDQPEMLAYNLSYITDKTTDIATYNLKLPKNIEHMKLGGSTLDWFLMQSNAHKYTKSRQTGFYGVRGKTRGPESSCIYDIAKGNVMMLDLDNSSNVITQRINQLEAIGMTNILLGFTWGWRMLSPEEPLTKSKKGSRKVLVLLSDGDNVDLNIPSKQGAHNWTSQPYVYSSYGLPYLNRLKISASLQLSEFQELNLLNDIGGPYNKQASLARKEVLDTRLTQACIHAKKTGIEVYTIAFGSAFAGSTTSKLLKGCATSDLHNYHAGVHDLQDVFQDVATKVSQLYLSQ